MHDGLFQYINKRKIEEKLRDKVEFLVFSPQPRLDHSPRKFDNIRVLNPIWFATIVDYIKHAQNFS